MSIIVVSIVWELRIMHLVTCIEYYNIALGVVTQTLGKIIKMLMKVGKLQCLMIIMVVDTNSYNLLSGLHFMIEIGAIVDVEKGMIQVRQGLGNDVQVLSLNMVNMLQVAKDKFQTVSSATTMVELGLGQLDLNEVEQTTGYFSNNGQSSDGSEKDAFDGDTTKT